jgi:anti-anti-sigma factor
MEPLPGHLDVSLATRSDGALVIALAGELDLATSSELATKLEELAGQPHRPVIVDLSHLTFLDSSGIALLVAESRRRVDSGGRLVLAGPTGEVRRVLEIARISEVVAVEPSVESSSPDVGDTATG